MPRRMTDELKAKLARLHNATPAMLTDELGNVRARMKMLKEDEDIIKTVMEARLKAPELRFDANKDAVKGDKYILQVIKTSVARFSQEIARQFISEEDWLKCFKNSEMTQYRVKRIDEAEESTGVKETEEVGV